MKFNILFISMEKVYLVYQIENLKNGKRYVGKTTNFKQRVAYHKTYLRRNVHHNEYLQRAWNKYGEKCFEFKVLQTFPTRSQMDLAEEFLILEGQTHLPPKGYNIQLGGWSDNPSERGLGKIREKAKAQMREVQQFDLEGTFITEYSSIKEAAQTVGADNSQIMKCCKGQAVTCKGYQFKYKEDSREVGKVLPMNERTSMYNTLNKSKAVIQVKDGEVIARYASAAEAARQNTFTTREGTAISSISQCARGKTKSAYGYCWIYEKDFVY